MILVIKAHLKLTATCSYVYILEGAELVKSLLFLTF